MNPLRSRMVEDRYLRDSARALVEADVAHLKGDLERKSLGARLTGRLKDGASDVYDEAVAVASDNKGVLAALLAATAIWFARNPIGELLFGEDSSAGDDPDDTDDRDRDRVER